MSTAAVGSNPLGLTGALGGAFDLLGALRTDYTLTASTSTATSSELATLVAAHLPGRGVCIEADSFSSIPTSSVLDRFNTVNQTRDDLVHSLTDIRQILAPCEAEIAAITSRLGLLEKEWAEAAG